MSTSFSGIGSPETASTMLALAMQDRLGLQAPPLPRYYHSIEWSVPAQEELKIHPASVHGDHCIFGDIKQFFIDDLQPHINAIVSQCPQRAHSLLGKTVKDGLAMQTRGYCIRHQKVCTMRPAIKEIAGTSCVDWSSIGKIEQSAGKTMVYLLAWYGLRIHFQEPIIVQENVRSFPIELHSEFLGLYYFIDAYTFNASDFGIPVNRLRQWVVLRHKAKTMSQIGPLSNFVKRFQRICNITWRDLLIAEDEEILSELHWAIKRKKSCASIAGLGPEDLNPQEWRSFWMALTDVEQRFLASYECIDSEAAAQLNQNPKSGFVMMSKGKELHTIIKNNGIIWTGGRWLTPIELMLTQGFDVLSSTRMAEPNDADATATCSFAIPRQTRRRNDVKAQVGNGMSVPCAAVMHMFIGLGIHRADGNRGDSSITAEVG